MSDAKLFRLLDGEALEIPGTAVALERSSEDLVKAQTLFQRSYDKS